MFEGSLVESRGLVVSGAQKWTALGSLTMQCAVVGLVILVPLLRPEALRIAAIPAPLAVPFPVKPPEPVRVRTTAAASTSSAMSAPAAAAPIAEATQRFEFHPGGTGDGPAPQFVSSLPFGSGGSGPIPGLNVGTATVPTPVRARDEGPVKVSKGVVEGLLLEPIRPVYPAIAKATGTQGSVVMEAVISKSGRIESLHVVSGHPLLRDAAMKAVAAARYRPYKLNDEAVDVQTTITVVFQLGS